MASCSGSSKKVVYTALAGNVAIALTKLGAAAYTGGAAMLSEAVHSLVDTANEVLLLVGMRRASRPPDEEHPLGHGRELYFWSLIVALLIFALGAGVAVYEGIARLLHPEPIESPGVIYLVLAVSLVFETGSWLVALREFGAAKGPLGYFRAALESKDPTLFIVLFEDSAAIIGIAIAFVGTFAAVTLDRPALDGVASLAIGVVLGATAILLARESKGLLLGEPARVDLVRSIRLLAEQEPGVVRVNGVLTVHLAPQEIVVALSLEFADALTVPAIEAAVDGIEARLRAAHPEVTTVFIKPQSPGRYRQANERRFARPA